MCPNCPLRPWLSKVRRKSWTNEANHETDLKLCMRLRALASITPYMPKCPYYPEVENIGRFNGSIPIRHEKLNGFVKYEQKKLVW